MYYMDLAGLAKVVQSAQANLGILRKDTDRLKSWIDYDKSQYNYYMAKGNENFAKGFLNNIASNETLIKQNQALIENYIRFLPQVYKEIAPDGRDNEENRYREGAS